jgi:hypothetical protein
MSKCYGVIITSECTVGFRLRSYRLSTVQSDISCYIVKLVLHKRKPTVRIILGAVVVAIIWCLDLQLPVQSVSITTKIVSSNPVHGEVYSIPHYGIKFVSDLRQVGCFLLVLHCDIIWNLWENWE